MSFSLLAMYTPLIPFVVYEFVFLPARIPYIKASASESRSQRVYRYVMFVLMLVLVFAGAAWSSWLNAGDVLKGPLMTGMFTVFPVLFIEVVLYFLKLDAGNKPSMPMRYVLSTATVVPIGLPAVTAVILALQ